MLIKLKGRRGSSVPHPITLQSKRLREKAQWMWCLLANAEDQSLGKLSRYGSSLPSRTLEQVSLEKAD